MKIRVYNEEPVEDKEREFILKLEKVGNAVNLILVNEKGAEISKGILLQITSEMKLHRYSYINDKLGLPLDENERLTLTELPD